MPDSNFPSSRRLLVGLSGLSVILAGAWIATAVRAHTLRIKLEQAEADRSVPAEIPRTIQPAADKEKLLQRLLDERGAAYATLQTAYDALQKQSVAPPAPEAADTNPLPQRESRGSWLDRLRTEDPVRYKQIQAEREQRRQRVEALVRDQLDRVDDRQQTASTQYEVDLLNQIANTIATLDDLRQRRQQLRELPEEERRAVAQQLGAESREAYETLSNLRAQDRQLQLQQLASQIGYQDQAGQNAFIEKVQTIYDETDTNPLRFMGSGRFGGGWPSAPQP